jgi:hypothetical protein
MKPPLPSTATQHALLQMKRKALLRMKQKALGVLRMKRKALLRMKRKAMFGARQSCEGAGGVLNMIGRGGGSYTGLRCIRCMRSGPEW